MRRTEKLVATPDLSRKLTTITLYTCSSKTQQTRHPNIKVPTIPAVMTIDMAVIAKKTLHWSGWWIAVEAIHLPPYYLQVKAPVPAIHQYRVTAMPYAKALVVIAATVHDYLHQIEQRPTGLEAAHRLDLQRGYNCSLSKMCLFVAGVKN
jgi:hypothetical protein